MQPRLLVALFSNRVINRWNGLDQQMVGATSLNVFKNRLVRIKKYEDGLLRGLMRRALGFSGGVSYW